MLGLILYLTKISAIFAYCKLQNLSCIQKILTTQAKNLYFKLGKNYFFVKYEEMKKNQHYAFRKLKKRITLGL